MVWAGKGCKESLSGKTNEQIGGMMAKTNKAQMNKTNGWIMYVGKAGAEAEVIESHVNLVRKIAQNLIGRLPPTVQIEDLMQAGMLGLLEASKNFDTSKGASFETYASIRIRGSMLDEIRKNDWAPRSVHRNTRRIGEAVRKIENQQGRDARDLEVAQSLELSLSEYHQMLQDSNGVKVFGFEEAGIHEDMISAGITAPYLSPLEGLQREDFRHNLASGIAGLPEREKLVLTLYYEEELNLREIGEVLGVSESRASQIHSQAMLRLQSRLKEWTAPSP